MALIAVEGIDSSGKTTLCEELRKIYIKDTRQRIIVYHFPDRRKLPYGPTIDAYLKMQINLTPEEVHRLFAAQRQDMKQQIRKDLDDDKIVVIDRYYYSGIAYGMAAGLDCEACERMEDGLPVPDIILYLDIPVEVAMSRGNMERYDVISFQTKVQMEYRRMKEKHWFVFEEGKAGQGSVCHSPNSSFGHDYSRRVRWRQARRYPSKVLQLNRVRRAGGGWTSSLLLQLLPNLPLEKAGICGNCRTKETSGPFRHLVTFVVESLSCL